MKNVILLLMLSVIVVSINTQIKTYVITEEEMHRGLESCRIELRIDEKNNKLYLELFEQGRTLIYTSFEKHFPNKYLSIYNCRWIQEKEVDGSIVDQDYPIIFTFKVYAPDESNKREIRRQSYFYNGKPKPWHGPIQLFKGYLK
jgi:hypothetical protein